MLLGLLVSFKNTCMIVSFLLTKLHLDPHAPWDRGQTSLQSCLPWPLATSVNFPLNSTLRLHVAGDWKPFSFNSVVCHALLLPRPCQCGFLHSNHFLQPLPTYCFTTWVHGLSSEVTSSPISPALMLSWLSVWAQLKAFTPLHGILCWLTIFILTSKGGFLFTFELPLCFTYEMTSHPSGLYSSTYLINRQANRWPPWMWLDHGCPLYHPILGRNRSWMTRLLYMFSFHMCLCFL